VPVQPKLPSIGHGVRKLNVHDACPFPVPAPPCRRMQAPEISRPPFLKMVGNLTFDFLHQSSSGNSHRAARLHKTSEVVQVQVVCSVVRERIDAHDGVEEFVGERQRTGIRVDRENTVLNAGIPDALDVLRGAKPQVGCPHLHAKFATQKDRR
jgi:hypothetical protein